jgi:hypothetical protein
MYPKNHHPYIAPNLKRPHISRNGSKNKNKVKINFILKIKYCVCFSK